MVDVKSKVTRSYGGRCGSGVGQLNWPFHLVVDEDSQFIFVVNQYNNTVVLLSPRLEFVREFSERVAMLLLFSCRVHTFATKPVSDVINLFVHV